MNGVRGVRIGLSLAEGTSEKGEGGGDTGGVGLVLRVLSSEEGKRIRLGTNLPLLSRLVLLEFASMGARLPWYRSMSCWVALSVVVGLSGNVIGLSVYPFVRFSFIGLSVCQIISRVFREGMALLSPDGVGYLETYDG